METSRRWIFIHIPKTGGTSIRRALGPDFAHRGRFSAPHINVEAMRDHLGERWAEAYTFGFARNPWDRMVSLFHHKAHVSGLRAERFQHWLRVASKGLTVRPRPVPCWDSLGDGQEILVDFVGRFERLGEDFATICRELGVAKRLLAANRSNRPRDWRPYYDDETAEAIARFYACDIERFGYGWDDYAS